MIYAAKEQKDFIVTCNCGCNEGLVFQFQKDPDCDDFVYISLIQSQWYANQDRFLDRWKKKLKKIGSILRNNDYTYSEIVMKKEEFHELANTIEQVCRK